MKKYLLFILIIIGAIIYGIKTDIIGKYFFDKAMENAKEYNEFNKVKIYLNISCKLNYYKACLALGVIYQKGIKNDEVQIKNSVLAKEYFDKVCDLRHYECKEIGYLLFRLKDKNLSEYYFDKACNLDKNELANDCGIIGMAYEKGKYTSDNNRLSIPTEYYFEKNIYKAKEFYKRGCEKNDIISCYSLGKLFKKENELFKAFETLQKVCEMKDLFTSICSDSCSIVGDMYYNGEGITQSYFEALKYYKKACQLKDKKGCEKYAQLKNFMIKYGMLKNDL